jgi:hypothetical protein
MECAFLGTSRTPEFDGEDSRGALSFVFDGEINFLQSQFQIVVSTWKWNDRCFALDAKKVRASIKNPGFGPGFS